MKTHPAALLDEYTALQEGSNDHQIRAVIELSGRLDDARLEESLRRSFEAVPILALGMEKRGKAWRWIEREGFPEAGSFYRIVQADGVDESRQALEKALGTGPNQERGPQLFLTCIRGRGGDTLCVVVNHVAMDGSGFKSYLALLASLYGESLSADNRGPLWPSANREVGNRDALLILRALGIRTRLGLLRRGASKSIAASQTLDGPGSARDGAEAPSARLFQWQGELEPFERLRGPSSGGDGRPTVNDCLLALVFAALGDTTKERAGGGDTRAELAFMVDERRYDASAALSPYCNASSMEGLSVENTRLPLPELAREVASRTAGIKRGYPGLANLEKIRLAKALLPGPAFRAAIKRAIRSARLSTTNLGRMEMAGLAFGDTPARLAYFVTALKEEPALQFSFSTSGDRVAITSYGRYSPANAERIAAIYGKFDSLLEGPDRPLKPRPGRSR